ncbi:hypothetical protein CTA2_8453 [Colletotrichum tanaceti]|uniref:Uncharacterized protein n=1 Tax=Colletotrichum tanaceti TaxID=1306861 RepID=A0A4U6XJX7_9PEZI|nr:hypothetical protein CTA2_8453 [Colletotrichum tanaceti]TKW55913.1 hypothetical protein CTA1_10966 [Colletotrichum tanaceti]
MYERLGPQIHDVQGRKAPVRTEAAQRLPSPHHLVLHTESTAKMGGGPKVPYPKHVWSPAGGWYAQPANWKRNTAVIGAVMAGVVAVLWKISAEKEVRYVMPQEGRFFPSRYWSKQLIEYDREQAARKAKDTAQAEAVQNS